MGANFHGLQVFCLFVGWGLYPQIPWKIKPPWNLMIPQCMELNEDFNILRFFSPSKFSFKNESTGMDLKKEETTIRWYEKLDQTLKKWLKLMSECIY